MHNRRSTSGFTLVELMIIVVLLGIVAAVALPSFSQLISGNRTQSAAAELASLLQFSRETALTRRTAASVCVNDDNTIWFVNLGAECDRDSALRTLEIPAGVEIASSADTVTFRHNGSAPAQTIVLCHDEDFSNGYTLAIRASGMVQNSKRGQTAEGNSMSSCEP